MNSELCLGDIMKGKYDYGILPNNNARTVTLGYKPSILVVYLGISIDAYDPCSNLYINNEWWYATGESSMYYKSDNSDPTKSKFNDVIITDTGFQLTGVNSDRTHGGYFAIP